MDRLKDDITRADFSIWAEEFYVHLDEVGGWARISALLKDIRAERSFLTEDVVMESAERAHQKNGDFHNCEVDLGARDRELLAYLLRRLNKKTKTTAAGTSSGFEVFRRIGMRLHFQQVGF